MAEWTLLGGLVSLDGLGLRSFWRMLLVTPVSLLSIFCMVPHRMDARKSRTLFLTVFGFLWLNFLVSHLTGFPTPISGKLGSIVKGQVEYVLYPLLLTKYRNWRTVFLMLTIGTLSAQAEALAALVFPVGYPVYIRTLLTAVVFALLSSFMVCQRRAIWESMGRRETDWATLSALPALTCAVLLLFRCYPDPLCPTSQNPLGILLMALFLPVSYRILFRTLRAQRTQARMEQDAALLRVQIRMVEDQERQMARRIQAETVARHDWRHFLRVLLAYLDAGDTEAARTELSTHLARSTQPARRYCDDMVINQLLSHYARRAEEASIQIFIRAILPELPPERRTGLMVALCNVLENAVHACAQVPPPSRRFIDVKLWRKGRQVFLEVSNAYAGALSVDPQTGLPRSRQPGHGYGLQSLAAYLGKRPDWFAEDGVFTISLLL